MGSSGKVVNLVVGKEVTSIGSQFQKAYIGTPTAKLSLTLEEGSKLSSIGNDAFKDNTFFVSIDLSNAGNLTMGTSAFNNVSNLTEFSTNKGTLTLNTLALGNLKKLQTLNWNASSTTLNWTTGLATTVTFTSGATTANPASSSGTISVSKDIVASTYSSASGYGTYSGSYVYYGNMTWTMTGAGTQTGTSNQSATGPAATSTTKATYAWSGTDNTGNHPLYNMSSSVSAGATVNLGDTVVSVPNYLFTTGIYAFETKTGTLTRSYTAKGSATYSKASNQSTSGATTAANIRNNPNSYDVYLYNSGYNNSYGWYIQKANATAVKLTTTVSGTMTVTTTVTQSCAITEGVKVSNPTNINVGRVNSQSKQLTSIGQSAFGWIQIPITSANDDLPSAQVTSTFTVATPTVTATRTSTSQTLAKAKQLGNTNNAIQIYYNYNGSNWGSHGCLYVYRYNTSNTWQYTTLATGYSYTSWTYPGVSNLSSYNATVVGTNGMGLQVTTKATDSITVSLTSSTINIPASTTTTKVWSTVNNTVTAGSSTGSNGMPAGSVLKIANFGIAGPNMTINSGAFIGAKILEQVYLAGTVENVNAIAFSTRNTGSTDKIYVYGKSAIGEFTTSTGLSAQNDLAVEYRKDAKDLGRYINHYQIGAPVYAYLFETDPDKYLINIVGTGATYDTYTASNSPAWAASYAGKVTQLIVDDTVTGIGPYLFYGHTALTTVQFGTGLTSIGAHAFGNCTGLDSFTVPATLTSVGERILEGAAVKTVYYNANTEDAYHSMSGCDANEIILGANVTKIGDGTLGDISGDFFVEAGEALR
jgi:hypothetical protein